jgi:hypothetical protein
VSDVVQNVSPQLDLFRPLIEVGEDVDDSRPYPVRFHEHNPQVMELLARLTRRARARSASQRVGFRMVWEMARWMYVRSTRDDSGFKLNNCLQYFYSRELMRRYPDLADVFETRERRKAS